MLTLIANFNMITLSIKDFFLILLELYAVHLRKVVRIVYSKENISLELIGMNYTEYCELITKVSVKRSCLAVNKEIFQRKQNIIENNN